MKNLVNGSMSEKTHLISYVMDLSDVPPFMCSPFIEGWIWADKPGELLKFIFDELISTYLINSLIFNEEYNDEENDEISFLEAKDIYCNFKNESVNQVDLLVKEYEKINDELDYNELLNSLINLENILKELNIDFKTEAYFSPLEARRSNMLKTEQFDYSNLIDNFY